MTLTDSGGVTKETYYHKVPGILLDKQTEWIETIEEGWNYIAGPSKTKILYLIKNIKQSEVHSNCLGDGNASEKIIDIIYDYIHARKQKSTNLSTSYR